MLRTMTAKKATSAPELIVPKTKPATDIVPQLSGGGRFVLQWLTYAFWGWSAALLTWLVASILGSLVFDTVFVNATIAYALAGTLVVVPLAFICDHFWSKYETDRERTNGENVIMVLHAVLFALIAISALITLAFSLTQLLIGSSTDVGYRASTSAVTAILFAALFIRTLNPRPLRFVQKWYRYGMAILTVTIIILAIVGPIRSERGSASDELISKNLSALSSDITRQTRANDELPKSLDDVKTNRSAVKDLIESDLVTYKAIGKLAEENEYTRRYIPRSEYLGYQLCVTFKQPSQSYKQLTRYNESSSSRSYPSEDYDTSVSARIHPAGDVCYKVKVLVSSTSSNPPRVIQ